MNGLFSLGGNDQDQKKAWAWNRTRPRNALLGTSEIAHDELGNEIHWSAYGDASSPYGWEIDHHPTPKSLGGGDTPDNLRALHYSANRSHGGLLGAALNALAPHGKK